VAREKGTILAGGVTQTEVYNVTKNKEDVREELKKALQTLVENDVDLIICEVSIILLLDHHILAQVIFSGPWENT